MIKVVVIVLLVDKIKGGIGAEIGRGRVVVIVVAIVGVFGSAGENVVKCSTGTASYEKVQQKKGRRAFTAVVVVVVIRRRG
jgi:hypothetical protein